MIAQEDWVNIVNESAYTVPAIAKAYGINETSLRSYLFKGVVPRQANQNKIQKIMEELMSDPKLQKHPSYGYATQEQIEALKDMGIGPDRDRLLKQIAEQTKRKGKRA
jgi:hypothetical protein